MQRSGLAMEQHTYCVVVQWMVALPSNARHLHVPRRQLGTLAQEFLSMSTVAWCPSRPSAVKVATRLFMMHMRAEIEELHEQAAVVDRRVHRAIQRTGLPIDPRGDVVQWVRGLSLNYKIERTISAYARQDIGRGPPSRERAVQLRRGLVEVLRQDADSASDEAQDEDEEQESDEERESEEEQ